MRSATINASALSGWEAYRADEEGMLATGPSMREMASTGAHIPLGSFVDFSEAVVERTRDVAIPWLVGVHYDLASLDVVGAAVQAAAKVGTALHRLTNYFALLQDCTMIRLDVNGSHATVSYRILDPDIWPRHSDAMFTLGIVSQIIRDGGEAGWGNVEFSFEARQHEMRGDIARVVRAPCSFGADSNQIRFPVTLMDRAYGTTAAPLDVRALNRRIVEAHRTSPLITRLASFVYRDLNSLTIDQERIAQEIGMSSRTMRRKLAGEGTSFQQVLDECRMRQASFEFRVQPHLSIAQIALRLGYSEHSTFTRAFHRWSGISPQTYRSQLACTEH